MKKIILIFTFLISATLSFANLEDTLNLLNSADKKEIEGRIDSIADNRGVKIYVNTLPEDEGFQISDPEKAVIINLKKAENSNKYETEILFSKDMDVEDMGEDVNQILDSSSDLLKEKKYTDYLMAVLDGVDGILADVKISDIKADTGYSEEEESNKSNNIYWLVFVAFGALVFLKNRKSIIHKIEKYKKKIKDNRKY